MFDQIKKKKRKRWVLAQNNFLQLKKSKENSLFFSQGYYFIFYEFFSLI